MPVAPQCLDQHHGTLDGLAILRRAVLSCEVTEQGLPLEASLSEHVQLAWLGTGCEDDPRDGF